MGYITVGTENVQTIDLYYEDHGAGQPIVLIHGWPLSSVAWEKQVPALLHAGYRVIAYDRRGFGNSSKPAVGYHYDTFAADLNTLITTLDLHDAVLVGHAMGTGEITRYLGMYGPDRVAKAALISVLPPFLRKTTDNPIGVDSSVFAGVLARIAKDRYAYTSEFFNNFYNLDVLTGDQISDEAVRASWNIAAKASGLAFAQCVATWTTDMRADVARIGGMHLPMLLIHGDQDRVLPITSTAIPYSETVATSRLFTVKHGPHGLPWTHAEQVNRELLAFLA